MLAVNKAVQAETSIEPLPLTRSYKTVLASKSPSIISRSTGLIKWVLVTGFAAMALYFRNRQKNQSTKFRTTLFFEIPVTVGKALASRSNVRFKLFNDYDCVNEPFERVASVIGTDVSEQGNNFAMHVEFDEKRDYKIIKSFLLTQRNELEVSTRIWCEHEGVHILVLHYRESRFPWIIKITNDGVYAARRID